MSRNVKNVERSVFEKLRNFICEDENLSRIVAVKRQIFLTEEEYDFVAGVKYINIDLPDNIEVMQYCDEWYICCSGSKIINEEVDLIEPADEAYKKAAGLFLMGAGKIDLAQNLHEIDVIDNVLGVVNDEDNTKEVIFQCETIQSLFAPYKLYKVNGYNIKYSEDIIRLIGILKILTLEYLTDVTKEAINRILLLESSRSVAPLLMNICNSKDNKMVYLQLYRALEYLFIIHKAMELGEKYKIDRNSMVSMISDENILRQSEEKHVIDLVANYATDLTKDPYIEYLVENQIMEDNRIRADQSDEDVFREDTREKIDEKLAKYIYRVRCQIAHFKYKQEVIKDEKTLSIHNGWLANLVLSMYEKLDDVIVEINEYFSIWSDFSTFELYKS